MFTSVYRPTEYKQVVGNKQLTQPFIKWLLEWDPAQKKEKCALVSGLTGIGKSLLVELLLKKHDYHIIELATDDHRDREYINNVVKPMLKMSKTFNEQANVLVVSDIDVGGDYGFISSLVECIKETKIPIVCICNNRFEQNIKPILTHCIDFKMTKPTYNEVYTLLYNVIVAEKIKIKETELKELYVQSNGDIRFMLNTLQFGMRKGNKNLQSSNIFETTGRLLMMDESIEKKYETYWLSNDLHSLMIQENYVNNIMGMKKPIAALNNMSYSADALSDVDLFESYVNMTNWEFEPYVATSLINATSKCNKNGMVKFPQFLGRTSTMYKNKREKLNYEDAIFGKDKSTKDKSTKDKEQIKPAKVSKIDSKTEVKEKKPRGRPKKAV